MKKQLAIIFLAAITLMACGGGTQSQAQKTKPSSDIVTDIWRAYLTSNYSEVTEKNVNAVLKVLEKNADNTAATLTINGQTDELVFGESDESTTEAPDDEDDEFGPPESDYYTYYSLAAYPLNKGGYIVLFNYDASSWGLKTLSVFLFKDNKLTRLKNSFPPFYEELVSKEPPISDETDERVKLNGTEVIFLSQDCMITTFTAKSFTVSQGGMEEYTYKWNGEKFVE